MEGLKFIAKIFSIVFMFGMEVIYAQESIGCKYFYKIYEAENFVLESDFEKAKIAYNQVFKDYSRPYAKDMLVSCLVDLKLNKYDDLTRSKIIFLFKKGYTYKRLNNHSGFNKISNKEMKILKEAAKDSVDLLVDVELRSKIHDLFLDDQRIRNYVNFNFFRKKMFVKDSIIHVKFMQLLKENGGFIGENVIGISSYSFGSAESHLLSLHYDTDYKRELDMYLDRAIQEFQIHPLYYAAIKDRRSLNSDNTEVYGSFAIWGMENPLGIIDQNRRGICLDSMEEHERKIRNKNGVHLIYLM